MALHRHGEIDTSEDPAFERRQWVAERIGWTLMTVALLLGLAGLFGSGPLAQARARSADGALDVRYERFVRQYSQTDFQISITVPADGEIRLSVDGGYLDRASVVAIQPAPVETEVTPDGLVLVYRGSTPNVPVELDVRMKPEKFGSLRGTLGLEGGERVEISQLVYP